MLCDFLSQNFEMEFVTNNFLPPKGPQGTYFCTSVWIVVNIISFL